MDQGAEDAEAPGGAGPHTRPGSDWTGLPEDLLVKVAGTLAAQTEAGWAAKLKEWGIWTEEQRMQEMAKRKREGNCLFVFALVCKGWRKPQLKVGGQLRTRVRSDVIAPGSVALVKWALAEGCPRDNGYWTMSRYAAEHGHLELVQWLCGEGGFTMDKYVMMHAAFSGNLELVQWLRGKGCPFNAMACHSAVKHGHVEVLRWARENGAPWYASDRDEAEWKLGYTDDLGNLV